MALLCLLLILNQGSSPVHASVEETCKAAGRDYNFCVATLSADPGSASADTQGLAVIATKLTKAKATSIELTISALLKKNSDVKTRQCLGDCASMYSDLVDNLSDTIGYIQSKSYDQAKTYLSAAEDVGGNCEDGFKELDVPSPMTKENDDAQRLSSLALAITVLLK